MPGFKPRMDRISQLIQDYDVNGIVYSHVKFCDNSLFEIPEIEKTIKNGNTPLLSIENDYAWTDVERIRTRVEAFIEIL